MAISGENTHLGSSCLATLTKSSLSEAVEARVGNRRGGLRKNMKSVQDGIWVECRGTTPNVWSHASRVATGIPTVLCAFLWFLQDQMCPTAVYHLLSPTPKEAIVWRLKTWGGREWLFLGSGGWVVGISSRLPTKQANGLTSVCTVAPPKLSWHEKKF